MTKSGLRDLVHLQVSLVLVVRQYKTGVSEREKGNNIRLEQKRETVPGILNRRTGEQEG